MSIIHAVSTKLEGKTPVIPAGGTIRVVVTYTYDGKSAGQVVIAGEIPDGPGEHCRPPPPQLALDFALADDLPASSPSSSPRPRRIAWAKLLARIFAIDITRCRKCGGRRTSAPKSAAPGVAACQCRRTSTGEGPRD